MRLDDRFDDLIASLGGLPPHVARLPRASSSGCSARCGTRAREGLTPAELARRTGHASRELVTRWAWGADAHDLVTLEDDRIAVPDDVAVVLLDDDRSGVPRRPVRPRGDRQPRLGRHCSSSSGPATPMPSRPDRYRVAIERLTVQDIAVFFQEVARRAPAARRRPAAAAAADRRHPLRRRPLADRDGAPLPGHARSSASSSSRIPSPGPGPTSRRPGSADRITIEQAIVEAVGHAGEFDLAYFQYALHQLARRAGGAPRPPGTRSGRAGGWSCSTGPCRRTRTSSGPATAS